MSEERWPIVYEKEVELYHALSRAEDEGDRLAGRLREMFDFRGKRVLDLGCGTGKYVARFAPRCRTYVALDASPAMIAFARRMRSHHRNVAFVCGRAERLPLADGAADAVFASWVLSGLVPQESVGLAVEECLRVLVPGGSIWLFENDAGGEFMDLRDPDSRGWDWDRVVRLVEHHGFEVAERVETAFSFPDEAEARRVLGQVLGDAVSRRLEERPRRRIGHRVLILHREKPQS